jgi:hypothetical protein
MKIRNPNRGGGMKLHKYSLVNPAAACKTQINSNYGGTLAKKQQ